MSQPLIFKFKSKEKLIREFTKWLVGLTTTIIQLILLLLVFLSQ